MTPPPMTTADARSGISIDMLFLPLDLLVDEWCYSEAVIDIRTVEKINTRSKFRQ
jgi:hypothetical protein